MVNIIHVRIKVLGTCAHLHLNKNRIFTISFQFGIIYGRAPFPITQVLVRSCFQQQPDDSWISIWIPKIPTIKIISAIHSGVTEGVSPLIVYQIDCGLCLAF